MAKQWFGGEHYINVQIARYFIAVLQEAARKKDPDKKQVHWAILAAGVDQQLASEGYAPMLVDDPQRFSRCMALAKVLGLEQGDNPFPLYERKGYWAIKVSEYDEVLAVRMGMRANLSRIELLHKQAISESKREPTVARQEAVLELAVAERLAESSLQAIERLLASLGSDDNGAGPS